MTWINFPLLSKYNQITFKCKVILKQLRKGELLKLFFFLLRHSKRLFIKCADYFVSTSFTDGFHLQLRSME